MKCLVTGATGFIGSFLVRRLLAEGHEVSVVLRSSSTSSCWRISDLLPRLQIIRGDVTQAFAFHSEVTALKPEVCFHLAWQGVGSEARNSPEQLVANVTSSMQILELSHQAGCHTFVTVGSQAEYGLHDGVLDENVAPSPATAYAVAKFSLSQLSTKYCALAKMRLLWFRLFSAYGPMDDPAHMLPSLIKGLLSGESPKLTKGEQIWDYIFIEDAVNAIYLATLNLAASGIFNLASGNGIHLRHIIETARDLIDPSLPLDFGAQPYRHDQVMHLEGNVSKLRLAAQWAPHVNIETGLLKTIEWHKKIRREEFLQI